MYQPGIFSPPCEVTECSRSTCSCKRRQYSSAAGQGEAAQRLSSPAMAVQMKADTGKGEVELAAGHGDGPEAG